MAPAWITAVDAWVNSDMTSAKASCNATGSKKGSEGSIVDVDASISAVTMSRGTSIYPGRCSASIVRITRSISSAALWAELKTACAHVSSLNTLTCVSKPFTLWCRSGSLSRSAMPGAPLRINNGTCSAQALAAAFVTFNPPAP